MFKHAYVRGLLSGLVHSGQASFPSEEFGAKVADYIADRVDVPLFDADGNHAAVPMKTAAEVMSHILDASKHAAAQGFKPGPTSKIASVDDVAKLAHVHAVHLMRLAEEGSTLSPGEDGNDEPTTGEGKAEMMARPEGYAEDSRGKTDVDTRPGAVGKEEPSPNAPSNSPAGSNSAEEQSRTASFNALVARMRKLAEGSTLSPGMDGNMDAPTGEGKAEMMARPVDYALLPGQGAQGDVAPLAVGAALVGREMAAPNAPTNSPEGTNSVMEHTERAAALAKSAGLDPAWFAVFQKTASQVGDHLPRNLSDDEKVAHVRRMMGMTDTQKVAYVLDLQRRAALGQKKAEESSSFEAMLAAKKDEDKKDEDKKDEDKKDEDKKDEKMDDEKKEAHALLARIRAISAA